MGFVITCVALGNGWAAVLRKVAEPHVNKEPSSAGSARKPFTASLLPFGTWQGKIKESHFSQKIKYASRSRRLVIDCSPM